MRIFLGSPVLFEEAPKALRRALSSKGFKVSEEDALEATGRMLGFDSLEMWAHETAATTGSPFDHEISQAEQDERRAYQARQLSGYLQIPPDTARSVVEAVEPSGTRRGEARIPTPVINSDVLDALRKKVMDADAGRMSHLTIDVALDVLARLQMRITPRLTVDKCMSKADPIVTSLVATMEGAEPLLGRLANGWGVLSEAAERLVGEILIHPVDPYGPDTPRFLMALSPISKLAKVPERVLSRAITLQKIPALLARDLVSKTKQDLGPTKMEGLIYQSRNELGFYGWFPGIESAEHPTSEDWRPVISSRYRNGDARGLTSRGEGYEFTVDDTRERPEDYESNDIKSHFVTGNVTEDGIHLAVLRGYILSCASPDYVTDEDLMEFAEAHSPEMHELSGKLISELDADEIFAGGDVLIITHLERSSNAPPGFGLSFLMHILRMLKKTHRRLAGVAYVVKPLQFRYPFDNRLPTRVTRDFVQSSIKICMIFHEIAERCGLPGPTFRVAPQVKSFDLDPDEIREMASQIRRL